MESSSRIDIEKFNGKKIETWKFNMEGLLVDKEQWITMDPSTQPTGTQTTSTQSTIMSKEDREKLDRRERSTI
jgi:hypothetical protein